MPRKRSKYKKKRKQYVEAKKQQNIEMDKQKQVKDPSDTPENDEYNFYFERQSIGVYFYYDGYISQKNYSIKECHDVIYSLNFFKTPSVLFSAFFFCSVVYMIYCYIYQFEQYPYLQSYGIGFIVSYFCFTWCVNQTLDVCIQRYLYSLNKKLHEKNVHWRMHPWGLYLHLCVNYIEKEENSEEEEDEEDSMDKED